MSIWLLIRYRRLIFLFIISFLSVTIIISQVKFKVQPVHKSTDGSYPSTIVQPRLAILVPFRDRFDELLVFVPYISSFLENQNVRRYQIYILNQSSKYRFNRGALANVGYLLAKNSSEYIAIHDVDLLPLNKNLSYALPKGGPYHLSSPNYHPKYNYEKYFGGILLISNEHFELVNGFSNRYFGWGLEDDEFYTRIKAAKLAISHPENLTTGRNDTFLHFHYERKRDMFKTREQRATLKYRDRITGLKDIKYSVTSKHNLTIDDRYNATVFNIEIHCDFLQTPWCLPIQSKRTQTTRT